MDRHPRLGPYTVIDRIAVGGMGVVYLAEHDDESLAAVKVLDVKEDWDESPAQLFIREVQATARLHHDNIVAIYDYGVLGPEASIERFGPQTPYYVMEYVPYASLEQKAPSSWEDLEPIIEGVLLGLGHAHGSGVIHRDIKPGNILRGGEERGVVLTDFGIAHAVFTHTSTLGEDLTTGTHESASGTPLYMAPEQFMGTWRDYGPWTDLYAVGTVVWRFVCGRAPFSAPSFVELGLAHMSKPLPRLEPVFDVPPHLAVWLARMCAKDPRERPRSAAEALALLRRTPIDLPSWRDASKRHRARTQNAGLGLLGMREVPTVGREDARDALWDAVERGQSELAVVHLVGPPGVGKSHLARWCARQAAEVGATRTWQVDCAAEPPLAGLPGLLHAILRSAGLESAKLVERAENFCRDWDLDFDPRLVTEVMLADGAMSADQAFEPAARLLTALSADQPLLVWFDDVEHTPEVSSFVAYLAERHPTLPATVITTSDGVLAEPTGAVLDLGFLPDAAVEEILLSQVDLSRRVLDDTLAKCAGSPLFAVMLLENWVDSGRMTPGAGLAMDSTAFVSSLPNSISEIWSQRVEQVIADLATVRLLGPNRLRVASAPELVRGRMWAAAALGQVVDEAEWDEVCEAHGLRRIPFLVDELVRHRIVQRTENGFRFAHELLRDYLEGEAREAGVWRGLNHAAARVVERNGGAGLRLARLLREAGDASRAADVARSAANRARETFDVVALGDATQLWAECAAASKAGDDGARADLWTMQAYALLLKSAPEDRDEARRLLDGAARLLKRDLDHDVALRVSARRVVGALYLGDVAARAAELATLLEQPGGSTETLFEAQMALARAFAVAGDPDRMLAAGEAAARVATSDAERMQAAQLLGRALLELGRLDEAFAQIAAAHQLAHANNWVIAEARGYETTAFVCDARADFAEAATWHRRSLELFELVAPRTSYPDKQREYLARALLAAGDTDAARAEIARVRAGLDSGKTGFYTHIEDVELACAAAAAEWTACERLLRSAVTFERFEPYEIHLRALALAAIHADGHPDLAARIREGLAALVGPESADAEIQAARRLRS